MEGSESGNLHVYQVAPGERSKTPIWTAGVSDKIWEKGFVTLEQMDAFQVHLLYRNSLRPWRQGFTEFNEFFIS